MTTSPTTDTQSGGQTIPTQMRAMVLLDWNRYELQDVPVPTPGPMEVLLRVESAAICGTDLGLISGAFKKGWNWPPHFPFILGHEYAGEIVQLGDGVFDLEVGHRVAGTSHKSCGYCRNCYLGRYTLCENHGRIDRGHRQYGHNFNGAYAQYMVTGAKCLVRIPDSMTMDEAVMGDTASIAMHGVKRARLNPGDTVAVIGPGPMGLLAFQCARALGAARVILIGRGSRLQKGAELGAEVIDIEQEDPVEAVKARTDGRGAHVAIECSGAKIAARQAVDMTRKGGKVVYIAFPKEDVELPLIRIALDELDVLGSRANPNTLPEVIPLIANGTLQVNPLITHRVPLAEIDRAFTIFKTRQDGAVKVVVKPQQV